MEIVRRFEVIEGWGGEEESKWLRGRKDMGLVGSDGRVPEEVVEK